MLFMKPRSHVLWPTAQVSAFGAFLLLLLKSVHEKMKARISHKQKYNEYMEKLVKVREHWERLELGSVGQYFTAVKTDNKKYPQDLLKRGREEIVYLPGTVGWMFLVADVVKMMEWRLLYWFLGYDYSGLLEDPE